METHHDKKLVFARFAQQKALIAILAGLILILAVFEAGVSVGYHKAAFSFGSGDNFYRVFDDHRPKFPANLPGGHGTVGHIVSIEGTSFIVSSPDNIERIVSTDARTEMRYGRTAVGLTDIKPGMSVIVLGSPDATGTIQARLVRIVMPR